MPYRVDMLTAVHHDPTGCTVLTVTGEIDIEVADKLLAAGLAALPTDDEHHSLRIDLSAVTFLDASGLAALIAIRNATETAATPLTLHAPTRQVRRILDITALTDVFTITS